MPHFSRDNMFLAICLAVLMVCFLAYYVLHKERDFRPRPKTKWQKSSPYYMADPFLTEN